MPKSKYPQELDTSIEIPPVRDNIIEVGSDVINSLRSAIFQIERTLGLNPQGSVGNTLAERIDRALDGNGNIKKDALTASNVLSGPIVDADVSRVAAIQESKLKLNFPTTLLQDEISILNGELSSIISQVEELSLTLAVHLDSNALNRHGALSISVEDKVSVGTDDAAVDLESGSVQTAFETLYDSHINYTGSGISSENRSHMANQIYFDDANVSGIISSDDVQEAIENLALASQNTELTHQDLFHSNGLLRVGKIDSADNDEVGEILDEDISISFSKTTGASSGISTIIINDAVSLDGFLLEQSDIITIFDPSDTDGVVTGSYEIAGYQETSGILDSIDIYGFLGLDSTSNSTARISKNINARTNRSSLLVAAREEATLTAARSIQVCNPNAVSVISSGIIPYEVTTSNRFIDVTLDGETTISIDLYNGLVSRQSIDSIVSRINEQCAEDALDLLAYRLDMEEGRSELVLAHTLPDEASDKHTITISRSIDGGIDAAGFAYIEDAIISSTYGSTYYISGKPFTGLKTKVDSTLFTFSSGSVVVGNGSSGIDLLSAGVRSGDLVVITGASTIADNGTYLIKTVNETQLSIDSGQLPTGFAGASGDNLRVRIYSNTISFDSITFDAVSSSFGMTLLDVFMNSDRDILFSKRFEYQSIGSTVAVSLVDFTGEVAGEQFVLTISGGTNEIVLSLDGGVNKTIIGNNTYVWLHSGSKNVSLKLYIPSVSELNSIISSGGGTDILMSFFGFEGFNEDTNLFLARVPYANFEGRISGGLEPKNTGTSTPRAIGKLRTGTISVNDIGTDIKHKLQEVPFEDLRANGIVRGLEITNGSTNIDDFYVFDISNGVAYVRGRRLEVESHSQFVTDIRYTDSDKIFVSLDEDGNIKVESAIATCISPFGDSDDAMLATIEHDGSVNIIDFRLFINDLDLKVLNSITVSPQPGMGHFSDLGKALKYAKRFTEIFTDAGVPTVHLKSGVHEKIVEIDESSRLSSAWMTDPLITAAQNMIPTSELDEYIRQGLFIDFSVNITGEGDSTVIRNISRYTFSDQVIDFRGFLAIPGDGFTDHTIPLGKLTDGFVRISNLKIQDARLDIHDLNVLDGSSEPLPIFIDLEGVIFDLRTDFLNTRDLLTSVAGTPPYGISISEHDDITNNKGNVRIDGCKFLSCIINVGGPSRLRNLVITNNLLISSDQDQLISQDIYTFATANSGSNITIVGNHNTSMFVLSGVVGEADIAGSAGNGWGDRFGRAIQVGGDITTQGSVFAEGHKYNTTKTKIRRYTMDEFAIVDGDSIGWGTALTRPTYKDGSLTAQDEIYLIPSAEMKTADNLRLRIEDLHPGEKLVGIRIGHSHELTNTITWTVRIETGRIDGGGATLDMFTDQEFGTASPFTSSPNDLIDISSIISLTSGTTTWNVSGANDVLWFINIFHNHPTTQQLYWIELSIATDDIESSLGLS